MHFWSIGTKCFVIKSIVSVLKIRSDAPIDHTRKEQEAKKNLFHDHACMSEQWL